MTKFEAKFGKNSIAAVSALAGTILAMGAMVGADALAAQTTAAQTTQQGAFTAAQADRGKAVYEKSCAGCHQTDFYRDRLTRWENKPVSQLFDAISNTMPGDNVGSLLTSEYIDVLAYIFFVTGSPAGNSELTADNMASINIAPINGAAK